MLTKTPIIAFASLSFATACSSTSIKQPPEHNILNYMQVSDVIIGGTSLSCPAKLDTGAQTSSIHADNIQYDKQANIVTFTISGQNFEEAVIRTSNVKTKGERPVIKMNVSIAGMSPLETEASLSNRNGFNRPFLVGRNTLEDLNVAVTPQTSEYIIRKLQLSCSIPDSTPAFLAP